jgi:tRNA pseudouridine55 synthase
LKVDWEGLLLVDKPQGPTSHDVVARIRAATGQRRIGHTGTLDPMASGLLPLVLGRATRLVRFLPHSPKEYHGSLRLGLTTRSDDITGKLLSRHDGPMPDAEAVLGAAGELVGRRLQVPPAVSARKVRGERLYRLARRGIAAEAEAVEVKVDRFDLQPTDSSEIYTFEAVVSAGTYIRALVRDLGGLLGCGGVLDSLRRTRIGPMTPYPGLTFEPHGSPDVVSLREALIPMEEMALVPEPLHLEREEEAARFAQGAAVRTWPDGPSSGLFRVLAPDGLLLGIAEMKGGVLHPKVVLPPCP